MAYLGSWKIDDNLTFAANTHTASTGAATDADAVPAYRIYEDETTTAIVTGSMAKLDDDNTTGFYSEQVELSAASGFEKGKCYTIYISAAVSSVTGAMNHTFQIEAEVDANTLSPDFNATQKASINTEADTALSDIDLNHLIKATAGSEEPTNGSYLDQIMHKDSNQSFDDTTDSLEAIRDTLSSSSVTTVAAVSGDTVTVVPYTTWEFTIDGLADLTDAAGNGVFFTVKEKLTDADSSAILQIQEGVGLLYIDGAAAGDASKASLTVAGGEDEITVHVNASVTDVTQKRNATWDIKKVITTIEDADQMATGTFIVSAPAATRDLTVS